MTKHDYSTGSPPDGETGRAPVSLLGEMEISSRNLVLSYRIRNRTSGAIYVWDRLPDPDRSALFDDGLAYVFWEEPSTLVVARAVLAVPSNMTVTFRELPFVRRIGPDEDVSGTISLTLPVQEYSPFQEEPERWVPRRADRVRLVIGWVEDRPGMSTLERTEDGLSATVLRGIRERPLQILAQRVFHLPVDAALYPRDPNRASPFEDAGTPN